MQVDYTSFDKSVGYNCKNKKRPFYLLYGVYVLAREGNKKLYFKLDDPKYTSDGCTIPRVFRIIFGCPHKPEYLPASLIHDWILEHPETVNYNRKFASQIFKTVLLNEGVSPLKAHVMYLAVDIWQALKNVFIRKWR